MAPSPDERTDQTGGRGTRGDNRTSVDYALVDLVYSRRTKKLDDPDLLEHAVEVSTDDLLDDRR
jgi:hypothetical protein